MPQKSSNEKLAAKKAAVLGTQPKSRMPLFTGLAVVVLLAGAAFWYFGAQSTENASTPTATANASGDIVSMPVPTFDDGKAHYFQHKTGDLTIRYFVIKSVDGVVRAAFDACDVCWRAGKGYAQEGDFMVCRNCGQRFHSSKVNEVKGGKGFEIYEDHAAKWRWRLRASNGELVAVSEQGFASKSGVVKALDVVRRNAAEAEGHSEPEAAAESTPKAAPKRTRTKKDS